MINIQQYGRELVFTILLFTLFGCHKEKGLPDDIGNSFPWPGIQLFNLCEVSWEWDAYCVGSISKWADLSIVLSWNHGDDKKDVQEFQETYSKELSNARNSTQYNNRRRYVNAQMDEARKRRLEYIYYIYEWLDARVETGIKVTADKPLFGRVPGTNLADFFSASAYICFDSKTDPEVSYTSTNYIIYSYPDFEVVKAFSAVQPASNLTELFLPHTAAVPRCIVQLNKIPDEEYDEITFTFSLPLSGESLLNYSTVPISKPYDKTINKTLQGSVTVSFR